MKTGIPELTLHFREGCHLCEDMEQLLQELLEPDSYTLRRIDIDSNPHLTNAYNVRVPVLSCGEIELCEHFLDLDAVRSALSSYNKGSTP